MFALVIERLDRKHFNFSNHIVKSDITQAFEIFGRIANDRIKIFKNYRDSKSFLCSADIFALTVDDSEKYKTAIQKLNLIQYNFLIFILSNRLLIVYSDFVKIYIKLYPALFRDRRSRWLKSIKLFLS